MHMLVCEHSAYIHISIVFVALVISMQTLCYTASGICRFGHEIDAIVLVMYPYVYIPTNCDRSMIERPWQS